MSAPSVPGLRRLARRATLRRSVDLLSSFKYEQTDPARFYGLVADDTAATRGLDRAQERDVLEDHVVHCLVTAGTLAMVAL